MNKEPTPEQALALLDQAAANIAGNRLDHANLQLAVKILADFIAANQPASTPSHP